jgi:hypothetical protein
MHLNRLRLPPQQPNILLERLRLPKLHMRLFTRPPNRNHSSLPLHTLILNFLVRNPIRTTHVPRRARLFLQPLARFRRIALPVSPRLAVAVERRDLRHGCFKRCAQSTCRLEVHVEDIYGAGHDGCAALEVGSVGVRGGECFVVAARVPVEEHLEYFWGLDLRAEVHGLEAGLLAESAGYGGEDGGAGVGGVADGCSWEEGDEGDFGGRHFGDVGFEVVGFC